MLSLIKNSFKKLTVSYSEPKGVMPSGKDAPLDFLDIHKGFANSFNNEFINCCFMTTYAAILTAAIRKGACFFTFVNPAIESPIAPENFPPINTSGYESGTNSPDKSPNSRQIVRSYTRVTQKRRREIEKENQEKKKELLRSQANSVVCPDNYELKTEPSKLYQIDPLNEFSGQYLVGMQKTLIPVKVAPENKKNAVGGKGKRRSGNNRRKMSPRPPMQPRKKEETVIDEDGFQKVTGKKAARAKPQPVEVIAEQSVEVVKPKKVKKNKKKSTAPSKATILHSMKPSEEFLILEETENEDEEELETEPETKQVVVKSQKKKKQQKSVKKEEESDHVIAQKVAEETDKTSSDLTIFTYFCIGFFLAVVFMVFACHMWGFLGRITYPETSVQVEQAMPLETMWVAPSVKLDYFNISFGSNVTVN